MTDVVEHPTWCDPAQCTAGERSSQHRSATHHIEAERLGDVAIAAQLTCNADEPVSDAPVSVQLVLTRTDQPSVEGYHLDERTVRRLSELLDGALPALTRYGVQMTSSTSRVRSAKTPSGETSRSNSRSSPSKA